MAKGPQGHMDEIDKKAERQGDALRWVKDNGLRKETGGNPAGIGYLRGAKLDEMQTEAAQKRIIRKGK